MQEFAPQQTFKRTTLQRTDVPASNYEAVMGITELPPNGLIPRETHPGLEAGYVLRGSATLLAAGQPPLALRTGQSWKLPAGIQHEFRAGADGVKVVANWVVEKGKAFSSPAG
jgi:quercetin dioxygenase-like cupin family protein